MREGRIGITKKYKITVGKEEKGENIIIYDLKYPNVREKCTGNILVNN